MLRIPRLGLTVPVAEGVGKAAVLNRGYVGHYPHSAQPGGRGNVALAGHRNTHGEPFRHLDRLRPGDTVRVETRSALYTYAVAAPCRGPRPATGVIARSRARRAPHLRLHRARCLPHPDDLYAGVHLHLPAGGVGRVAVDAVQVSGGRGVP